MSKNKLAKFAELKVLPNVIEIPFSALSDTPFELKGKWNELFFGNDHPVVLELGCGKGEYTVGLARCFPEKNFIGIDIKGARIWTGAREAHDNGLRNAGFLRTHVELLNYFFAEAEVSEIWITFPDPQMKKVRKRLTSTGFITQYCRVLKPDGSIHLKTDSNFLYQYSVAMVKANNFPVITETDDLYASLADSSILGIRTYYEQQWLSRGKTIKYLRFIPHGEQLIEPEGDFELDDYRSYGRNYDRRE